MKKRNNKGFTLAELLIVVAIIAVLVAIAIPVFTSQLEKSRDAVSISNIRAAYAEAQAAFLTGSDGDNATVTKNASGEITKVTVSGVVTKGQKTDDTFSGLNEELPFDLDTEPASGSHNLEFNYSEGELDSVTWGT